MDDDLTDECTPYTWIRGTCPLCGSDQVIHHIVGMPVPDAYDSSPPWVIWEGCCGIGPDRECLTCKYSWFASEEGDDEDDDYADEDEDVVDLVPRPEEPAPRPPSRRPAPRFRTPDRSDGSPSRPLRPKPVRRPRPDRDA